MFTDKPLRLAAPIAGIDTVCGRRTTVMIPEGATVQVIPEKATDRIVEVVWAGRTVTVFVDDLKQSGNV